MTGPLVPFREIVLKVHSRCDLACDHCYIYEHADHSWRTRPKAITDEAISWTALRLAEHAKSHALPSVSVILHGGEPLLAGPARLRRVCEELTAALDGVAELDLRVHTNGLQLSPRYLDLFDEFGVRVGISLDGDRAANDRHRRFADGRTSHPLVLRAVELLREERYRHLYLGLLCTVDLANDPVAVHDALVALAPPRIDFLLPHATWDTPPARPDSSPTAYADWLLAVFDRWSAGGGTVPVRLFESVLSTLAGGPSLTESLGLAPADLVVVETDGALEQVDSLKSAYDGAAATGFDVFTHTLDEVAAHPGVRARQRGLAGVSGTCRRCPVVRSCGGGLYTHRYRAPDGFDNPSVYCADLEALIHGVEKRAAGALVPPAVTDPGALLAEQHELTRALLASLHRELDGRGGAVWERAWRLAVALDGGPLDGILAHPYTRTWLHHTLAALAEGRPGAVAGALALPSYLAAALVTAGERTPVAVGYAHGLLRLPTLGELDVGGPAESGEAEVRAVAGGFAVTAAGRAPRRVALDGRPAEGWRPVRLVGGRDGAPPLRLDDLDPHRDCFGVPVRPRLSERESAEWDRRFTAAWALLRRYAPDQAAEAAGALTTLTPLAPEPPRDPAGTPMLPDPAGTPLPRDPADPLALRHPAGTPAPRDPAEPPLSGRPPTHAPGVRGHGYGALGIALPPAPRELAMLLLRGFRRAKLNALLEVSDLYAQDGWWRHPAPWQEGEVPVSGLLAGLWERAGLTAFDPEGADRARRALTALASAPELTAAGRRLVAGLGREDAARVEERDHD
ncbi:radical SAM/SPASM protein FxsBH, inactivated beta-hydroxylase extension form [Streptomyces jumonjinensis]|uniref:FxsB family radical SAM/SPASM domain protein n=1 Tax=Streptomyces jumonjinensis TaxID=1945 RepID=A0A646KA23_STRJU|nr:radical SAM/SPASM protein FxsB, inactivated metallohydrolase extension form [Streptomyces jumonjinensis]MQS98967.1 FxsB family radical SAM/SPASM domain protein [Streptomyces jumonjinensis]